MTLQQNHKISDRWRYLAVFICLIIAFFVLIVWNINSGAVDISFYGNHEDIFTKKGRSNKCKYSYGRLGLPRIITAAILGGGLAVSGFLCKPFSTTLSQGLMF